MVKVVIGGSGVLAAELAGWYRASGATVHEVSFDSDLEPQVRAISGPVDLVVVADDFEPAHGGVATLARSAMGPAMLRLTFLPFHLAALLKPNLVDAQGRVALLTRADARMTVADSTGRYLERPFRAAAHALWRCLSVEWRKAGISAGLVGLGPGDTPTLSELVRAIGGTDADAYPVELVDSGGQVLGW